MFPAGTVPCGHKESEHKESSETDTNPMNCTRSLFYFLMPNMNIVVQVNV
jgi:hypothetical protein